METEKLEQLLANGSITQDEFDNLQDLMNASTQQEQQEEPQTETIGINDIDRIVQSKLDRAMAQERKNNADLKRKLERLQKEKLTDDELKQIEIDEKEKAIAEREAIIRKKENLLSAIKISKKLGLDDGEDNIEFMELITGKDESETRARATAFKKYMDKKITDGINKEVEKRFKNAGRSPETSTLNSGKNPYAKDSYNLTEQILLEQKDPELAQQLKKQIKN